MINANGGGFVASKVRRRRHALWSDTAADQFIRRPSRLPRVHRAAKTAQPMADPTLRWT